MGPRTRSRRSARSSDRQTLVRAEDARFARQVAAQPAGGSPPRRTDRFARSRHGRLGARQARRVSPEPRRDHPARLAQHERSRAVVRSRDHHEVGEDRRRRHARRAARALRTAESRGGISRRRARTRRRAGSGDGRTLNAPETAAGFPPRRVAAMVLRYWYLLRSSWPRVLDLIYWPTVQMLTWGFLQLYIGQNAGYFARAGGTFIGAVLLWDILFRGQLGFSVSFLEEMWARNLGNLM